ncbi:DNA cytosine methyltransferase [Vibrio parahaemolyticus]|uniref:DNA cytosine methyltransferase n=1 Tax=Vibrio parahaemolyticus TaxID=670 RepID=UPI001B81E34B|nr:DNA cytosine methyltransferase [Vibrio parahaemolyticus]UJW96446.1 DNA cytosine methyltransferase [Vibrio parahaemolyticus]HBB9944258.1 DNA cytosine methyltransferase [Vibrio parahaemolyticus]HBC3416014.1 DNA cytosine methyltransferase [Vibrio parahaemolyticus]HBC3601661.1 DNA cytosine methyltransferase [Vibrio parahaemolyticus]HBC3877611.1 DNA cytosine methyltransferase [Vibrio parahaemolyticus]
MLSSIDLFSGGGGLSEGMKQAGFSILSAVENNKDAAETFRANHESSYVFEDDIRLVSGTEILKRSNLLRGELDLLAGCPPCQGFSSLTRKYKRDDDRNSLINEVGRLVKELMPKTIMIENVPGLMNKGKPLLDAFLEEIHALGYISNHGVFQVADYGVPQHRKRFVLLAGLGFEVKIPQATHSEKASKDKKRWVTVREAFDGLDEPVLLKETYLDGGPQKFNWNVRRDISHVNVERLKHLKPGGSRFDIPDSLRPNCHKGNNKGFSNVYGRMSFNTVSPTITGGCTTLSKGRFGHPEKLRTISVREAARLQTFPDSFEFATDAVDSVCQIIGNALPCEFARVMSLACKDAISSNSTPFTRKF